MATITIRPESIAYRPLNADDTINLTRSFPRQPTASSVWQSITLREAQERGLFDSDRGTAVVSAEVASGELAGAAVHRRGKGWAAAVYVYADGSTNVNGRYRDRVDSMYRPTIPLADFVNDE